MQNRHFVLANLFPALFSVILFLFFNVFSRVHADKTWEPWEEDNQRFSFPLEKRDWFGTRNGPIKVVKMIWKKFSSELQMEEIINWNGQILLFKDRFNVYAR